MSDATEQASDQAKFAAREFVAKFERETESVLSEVVRDHMLFAFEIGYLRGRTDGVAASIQMMARR
jgi:hypothetical protein